MREVKKSIYNVSRPEHFGSIKKMPFDVPAAAGASAEEAEKKLVSWLEQNVDQKLQQLVNVNNLTNGTHYDVTIENFNELRSHLKWANIQNPEEWFKNKYNVQKVQFGRYDGSPTDRGFLHLYP